MVVYHAITTYQLLECIEHRKVHEKDKSAILIIPFFFAEKYPNYKDLELYGFFDEVVIVPYHTMPKKSEEIIEATIDLFEKNIGHYMEECTDFYVAGYQYYFSLFLIHKNKRFSIFEEAAGALSRVDVLREVDRKICIERYEIMERFGLYDTSNPCILDKLCDKRSQKEDFTDEKAVHFDAVRIFKKMTGNDQENLLRFFGITQKYRCKSNTTLVLSQHFSNLGLLSFEEQITIYKMFVDYFLEGENLLFKLHPDDMMYYKKIFPGAEIILQKFPSELTPYVFENLPSKIATISSTGINQIKQCFSSSMSLDFDYEKKYVHTHVYYVVGKILAFLHVKKVKTIGVYDLLLKKMCNERVNIEETDSIDEPSTTYIVDEYPIECRKSILDLCETFKKKQNVTVIFLNTNNDYCFYDIEHKEVYQDLYPVTVKVGSKDTIKKKYCIYIYTKDRKAVDMIKRFEVNKHLSNSEMDVKVEPSTNLEIQVAILEGKLKAAEQRLMYYIEKEKQTEEE